jgi:hypothetical protein
MREGCVQKHCVLPRTPHHLSCDALLAVFLCFFTSSALDAYSIGASSSILSVSLQRQHCSGDSTPERVCKTASVPALLAGGLLIIVLAKEASLFQKVARYGL